MKTTLTNFILTMVLVVILSMFLPWWHIMVASMITSYLIPLQKIKVFLIPFLAVFIIWMLHTFWLSYSNDFILANKIAVLLPLNGNPYLLVLVTAIIGGLAAGISGVFGNQLKQITSSS